MVYELRGTDGRYSFLRRGRADLADALFDFHGPANAALAERIREHARANGEEIVVIGNEWPAGITRVHWGWGDYQRVS